MFRKKSILLATITVFLLAAPGVMVAKGGPPNYDTPVTTSMYPFGSEPFYLAGADTSVPYINGVDGVRSVFNGTDLLLDLDYSRSVTRRTSSIDLNNPVPDSTGMTAARLGSWSNSSINMKVVGIQSLAVDTLAVSATNASFDMKSANGKRWYRVMFNGNNGSSRVNVTHASSTVWVIEAPAGSIARVSDVTTAKTTPIGNFSMDMKITVTMP